MALLLSPTSEPRRPALGVGSSHTPLMACQVPPDFCPPSRASQLVF